MKKLIFFVPFVFIFLIVNAIYVNAIEDDSCSPDQISPVISDYKDFTLEVGQTKPDYLEGIIATDNCETPVLYVEDRFVDLSKAGSYPLVYLASDKSGNITTVLVNVHVKLDITNPVLSGIVNREFKVGTVLSNALFLENVSATDNIDGDITTSISIDYTGVDVSTLGIYEVTYTIKDTNENTVSETIEVTIYDDPPIITLPLTIPEIEVFSSAPNWIDYIKVSDHDDPNPTLEIVNNHVDLNQVGLYTIEFKATDLSEFSSTAALKVKVIDTVKPEFNFISSFSHKIDDPKPNYLANVVISDNYDGIISNDLVIVHDLYVNLNKEGTYPIVFQVMDSSGNTNYLSTIVKVFDTIKPTISGTKDITLALNSTDVDYMLGVSANDNRSSDITNEIIIDDSNVDYQSVGTYKVNYMVSDLSGNVTIQTIKVEVVEDSTKPEILNTQDFTIEVNSVAPDYLNGISVSDDLDRHVTVNVDSSSVNLTTVGSYDLIYTSTDETGNVETITKKVHVVDTTEPVVTNLNNLTYEVHTTDPNYLQAITVSDNYDTLLTITVDSTNVNLNIVGTYVVVFVVTDSSNNSSTLSVNVSVLDTTGPSILGVKDLTVEINGTLPDYLNGISATDLYDTNLTPQVDSSKVKLDVLGTYEITYYVTDSSDNTSTQKATVNVVDTIKPEITGFKNVVIKKGDKFDPIKGIIATDTVDEEVLITASKNYNVNKPGKYTITITATDDSGNVSTATYKLTVEESHFAKYFIIYASIAFLIIAGSTGYVVFKLKRRY